MKKTTLHLFSFFIALFFTISFAFSQSLASYTITYTSEWNASDHNDNNTLPGNSHYSKLVGVVHNSTVQYWQLGEQASIGIENIAEIGNNTPFFNEVQANISVGNTLQYIDGDDLSTATGSITVRVMNISENYPLLTLVSMIAPSSDWFIGVNSLSLIDNNGNWKDSITLDMFVYDAGTENDDISYAFNNTPTNPQSIITSKNNVAPFNNVRVGTLTITLDSALGVEDSQNITSVGLYPNPSNGEMTIKTSLSNILNQALVYDILGKQVANFKNKNAENELQMDLTNLNNGVYLVRLILKDGSQSTKKVIIN